MTAGTFGMAIDYKQHAVLYCDDEPQNLVVFRYAMEEHFTVLTATTGEESLRILAEQDVAVLLSDQRMPGMDGVELCRRARELRPDTVRIIVTAYADMHAAIGAINEGHVTRYLVKPWRNEELVEVLRGAIDFVHLQQAMREMELRLLQSGQTRVATAIHDHLLHEIANPLGAMTLTLHQMSGMIDMLISHFDGEGAEISPEIKAELAELREANADAVAGAEQLHALAMRMRAGPRSLARGQCDAGRAVDATLRIIRREVERVASLEVVIESAPMVRIEAAELGQIMLNLVLNAAQAIETAGKRGCTIRITVSNSSDFARLTISDDGPGIESADIERVFQPYYTTKSNGTGIGLSIVRDMVRRNGGQINVTSQPGVRTNFELRLPLAP
jgi:signal transduction histidine kinase